MSGETGMAAAMAISASSADPGSGAACFRFCNWGKHDYRDAH